MFSRMIATVVAFVGTNALADPVRWELDAGGNGHIYEAIAVGPFTSWVTASASAHASQGHLVTITSAAENAFVFSLVRDRSDLWTTYPPSGARLGPWIGASRPDGSHMPLNEEWTWVTGEPWGYTNWVALDGEGPAPSYVQFWGNSGGWNDCGDSVWDIRGYVVEREPCPADFNSNFVLSVQDIFDFLAAYFDGQFSADFNDSQNLSVQDIFDFLAAYFAGCP